MTVKAIHTIFYCSTFVLLLGCSSQKIPSLSEANIQSHIKTLASDDFLGRQPGTIGEEKTVQYLVQQLKEIGIAPANGASYYQEFTIARLKYQTPSDMLITTQRGKTTYLPNKDFYAKTTYAVHQPVVVEDAEMVFAGFGIIAPEYNWDDYKNLEVQDKIVIILFSDPGLYTKDDSQFNGMNASPYADFNQKKKWALERGAKGILIVHHEFIDWDGIASSPSSNYSTTFVKGHHEHIADGLLFSGMISKPLMMALLQASGHKENYVEQALAKDFKGLQLITKISLTNTSISEDYLKTNNVLGILKGGKRPNEHLIYTAHWDHVGTRPARLGQDSIFNGAIDNASGTAMHLEVARAFKQMKRKPERSVLFFFTSAEEMGLLGARYYAEYPIYPLKEAVCVINADGHFATNKMKTATSVLKGYSQMDKYVDAAVAKMGRTTIEDLSPAYLNIFQRSDHFPFVEKGVPAVWAIGNQNPEKGGAAEQQKIADYMQHYHQVTDEYYEGFNAQNIAADALMNLLIGLELVNSTDWPNWNKDIEYKKIRDKSKLVSAAKSIDREYIKQLVEKISALYSKNYTFSQKGKKVSELLLTKLKKGDYYKVTNYDSLASYIKKDIFTITNDKHAQVIYRNPENASTTPQPQQPSINEFLKSVENYGFTNIEVKERTIGYVKMPIFFPIRMDAQAKEAADAMMKQFVNCKSIIFDLTECRGGDPAMISYLISYLYPKSQKVHLNDFYYRPNGSTMSSYTEEVKGVPLPNATIYVLTSSKTFSAGEEFSYDLKHLKRATLVGEITGGGAHTVEPRIIDEKFELMLPTGRAINPITKTNWEGVGVIPHYKTTAEQALQTTLELIEKGL